MWRVLMATALAAVVLSALTASAALLKVHGGNLAVFTYPVELGPIPATVDVDIDPDTLNPDSEGNYVMAYIELPPGYEVADIDVSTVTLEVVGVHGSVRAEPSPTEVADHDADGIPDRMVKFSREAVVALLDGRTGDITFRVTGEVSGSAFAGTDSITLLQSDGGAEDAQSAAADEPPSAPPMPTIEYEVQAGDTLIGIAARFGTTVEALIELNSIQNPNLIFYGYKLNVPYGGE